jgi:hypothetical protein
MKLKPAKKVKITVKKPIKSAVKRTTNRTVKKAKLTPLAQLVAKWDKDQGPLPSLFDTASKLDEVVNTLTDIQHLLDSALDDCVDLTDNARALSLLHLAYGMVRGVVEKTDALTSDLYRINRAQSK